MKGTNMNWLTRFYVAVIATSVLSLAPAHAAQVRALGVILDSQDGRLGSSSTTAGATVFPGDILSTDLDGDIKVRIGQTTYEILGDSTVAFYPGQSAPIAELRHGTLRVTNNSAAEGFVIYASDVRIESQPERPIQGEVSLKSPCELDVAARLGLMDVVAGSEKRSVDHDHAYRVIPEHSVGDRRDNAISPEDPDYHKHHTHAGCAVAAAQNGGKGPIGLASNSRFTQVALVALGAVALIPISKALESPDRP
jgi:hypothetical protein